MSFFPSRRIFISIFGLDIYWYGVLICIGMLLASILSIYMFKKNKLKSDDFIDIAIPVLIIGILCARLWYVIFEWNLYSDNLIEIFNIKNGGLAIQGGVIGGLIPAVIILKRRNISLLVAGDCIMPNVLLAQAIGRWGNFVNQEAFGSVCSYNFLKSLHLPKFIIDGMYINGQYWHPTFLYESLSNLIGFIVINFLVKTEIKGIKFGLYFIWYGIVRFFIESLRTDSLMFLSFKMAQITSIIFILCGLFIIVYSCKKTKK